MCNVAVIEFFIENVRHREFEGKRVLEVGSKYVNGSVRPLIEKFLNPREYVGVDIELGKYVDVICPVERLVERFGEESFETVIVTELLEHIKDWRIAIDNVKKVLKRGGYIYITTRSYGFPYHGHPHDFWRYQPEDMRSIFSDFNILSLAQDHEAPGVFLKARKPYNYMPRDLSKIALYSILIGGRIREIPNASDMPLVRRIAIRLWLLQSKVERFLLTLIINLYNKRKIR
jgi:SAM-dependent methyltransferase